MIFQRAVSFVLVPAGVVVAAFALAHWDAGRTRDIANDNDARRSGGPSVVTQRPPAVMGRDADHRDRSHSQLSRNRDRSDPPKVED
ncbi:hypothetical protein [Pigmentiphaga litoralis]|uniref:hypothetical protein n=1 Tax=Pigmentiphaga litoralis TaxID=516702 RepID=UPI003B436EEE